MTVVPAQALPPLLVPPSNGCPCTRAVNSPARTSHRESSVFLPTAVMASQRHRICMRSKSVAGVRHPKPEMSRLLAFFLRSAYIARKKSGSAPAVQCVQFVPEILWSIVPAANSQRSGCRLHRKKSAIIAVAAKPKSIHPQNAGNRKRLPAHH